MKRVVLVHWSAEEAAERAARLREAGYDVSCHSDPRADPRFLREGPPDAFAIDLARIPSQGREIGGWLRSGTGRLTIETMTEEETPAED